jgi:hypothetical protein
MASIGDVFRAGMMSIMKEKVLDIHPAWANAAAGRLGSAEGRCCSKKGENAGCGCRSLHLPLLQLLF